MPELLVLLVALGLCVIAVWVVLWVWANLEALSRYGRGVDSTWPRLRDRDPVQQPAQPERHA